MSFSASDVKALREKTGAGMMKCKEALKETNGDIDAAVDYLRKKGLAAAAKKASRVAAEGRIETLVEGGKGLILEVNCETDFVARTDDFMALMKDISMHIAAMNPRFVARDEVTDDVIAKEKEIFKAQAKESGKPDNVIDKIVDGKIDKFYSDVCLLEQSFVKNPDQTVGDLVTEAVAKLGENIKVCRFVRFKVGETTDTSDANEEAA